jgi:hypothetical protein
VLCLDCHLSCICIVISLVFRLSFVLYLSCHLPYIWIIFVLHLDYPLLYLDYPLLYLDCHFSCIWIILCFAS